MFQVKLIYTIVSIRLSKLNIGAILRVLNIRFDQGRHPRASLGFVLLATEPTIEDDMYKLAPPGVGIHFTRVRMPNEVNVENLATVEAELANAAAILQPDGDLDVICYACTSGSVVIGEDRVMSQLSHGSPKAKPTILTFSVKSDMREGLISPLSLSIL